MPCVACVCIHVFLGNDTLTTNVKKLKEEITWRLLYGGSGLSFSEP